MKRVLIAVATFGGAWNRKAGPVALLVFAIALAAATLSDRTVARADRTVPRPLDVQLLDADCAVRARVTSMKPLETVGNLTRHRIDIEILEQMWCRWAWATDSASFEAIGRAGVDTSEMLIPHRGELKQDHEYIILLRGGEVRGSPIAPDGLLEIGDDGTAVCGGGEVYGITPSGLRCSWSGAQVASPLNGAELASELTQARLNAAARRPLEAARSDASTFDRVGVPQ